MIVLFVLISALLFPVVGIAQDRDAICEALSKEWVIQKSLPPTSKDYRLYRIDSFYSPKLDACIHVEAKLIGAEVWVRDLTRTVMKNDKLEYPSGLNWNVLLHCDDAGVDEADIDAVRRYGGQVFDVPYKDWLTDGQGGLPRALKTPDRPFDRLACESALARWLTKWRE